MNFTPLNPAGVAANGLPYSLGTRSAGVCVHTSGILPIDAGGNVVSPGDMRAQTRFVLDVVKRILAEGGASLRDVAMNHIFITDVALFPEMNEVYRDYFSDPLPARFCIRADFVKPGCLVEIASVAYTSR
jgi:aminoacrylate peracid reductase